MRDTHLEITGVILQRLHIRYHFTPKYECPVCRAPVTRAPIELRAMNDVNEAITLFFGGNAESAAAPQSLENWGRLFVD
jgi:hypothetical protein